MVQESNELIYFRNFQQILACINPSVNVKVPIAALVIFIIQGPVLVYLLSFIWLSILIHFERGPQPGHEILKLGTDSYSPIASLGFTHSFPRLYPMHTK